MDTRFEGLPKAHLQPVSNGGLLSVAGYPPGCPPEGKGEKGVPVVGVGGRVRRVREERLLTQDELADRAGIGASTVARVENERHRVRPSARVLRALAAALDVDPVWLAFGRHAWDPTGPNPEEGVAR
jgi:DNA-binding XRE family transcriptional regulator